MAHCIGRKLKLPHIVKQGSWIFKLLLQVTLWVMAGEGWPSEARWWAIILKSCVWKYFEKKEYISHVDIALQHLAELAWGRCCIFSAMPAIPNLMWYAKQLARWNSSEIIRRFLCLQDETGWTLDLVGLSSFLWRASGRVEFLAAWANAVALFFAKTFWVSLMVEIKLFKCAHAFWTFY